MTGDDRKRHPLLTKAMHKMLLCLRDGEDEYALQDGLVVMVDLARFHPRTVQELLRLCLISEDSFSGGGTHTYVLNDEGRKMLDDPTYEPMIIEHHRTGKSVIR